MVLSEAMSQLESLVRDIVIFNSDQRFLLRFNHLHKFFVVFSKFQHFYLLSLVVFQELAFTAINIIRAF